MPRSRRRVPNRRPQTRGPTRPLPSSRNGRTRWSSSGCRRVTPPDSWWTRGGSLRPASAWSATRRRRQVQLSPSLKVAGRVIAAQPGRDVAILRIDPAALGSVRPLSLGCETTAGAQPQKGQKVFAIDTPLLMPKSTSAGVLGRIGPHSLETDLDLESATAGGPAFAVDGTLLGLTSIVDGSDERRPDYRVIRSGDICAVLASAEKAMASMPAPPGTRLPVDPAGVFPLAALEAAASRRAGNRTPFQTSSTFEVALITPVRVYAARNRVRPTSLPERTMRNQSVTAEAIRREEGLFDFGRWTDYFAGYPPVLVVRVTPRVKEGFWTMIARGAAQTQGVSLPPMKHLTSGFSRLQAFCGQTEVLPIHPFVLERQVSSATTTTEGLYVFDPNALGPCMWQREAGALLREVTRQGRHARPRRHDAPAGLAGLRVLSRRAVIPRARKGRSATCSRDFPASPSASPARRRAAPARRRRRRACARGGRRSCPADRRHRACRGPR